MSGSWSHNPCAPGNNRFTITTSTTGQSRSRPDLTSFSLSIFLGYLLPLSIAAFPAPAVISCLIKQQVIAFWQGWPLYSSIVMGMFRLMRCPQVSNPSHPNIPCAFAIGCSTITHMALLCTSLFARLPNYNFTHWAPYIQPRQIYLPPWPLNEPPIQSLEAGVLRFLQWDYGLSAAGFLIWCLAVHQSRMGLGHLRIR